MMFLAFYVNLSLNFFVCYPQIVYALLKAVLMLLSAAYCKLPDEIVFETQ
jgi:hypothetical protein